VKLRVRNNSVRLRVGPSEVRQLVATGHVEQSTAFGPPPGPRLVSRLELSPGRAVAATFDGGRLVVRVPAAVARQWADGDRISLSAEQPIGNGQVLRLLIEKDLECLDRAVPEPGDEDAYPNPAKSCAAEA